MNQKFTFYEVYILSSIMHHGLAMPGRFCMETLKKLFARGFIRYKSEEGGSGKLESKVYLTDKGLAQMNMFRHTPEVQARSFTQWVHPSTNQSMEVRNANAEG